MLFDIAIYVEKKEYTSYPLPSVLNKPSVLNPLMRVSKYQLPSACRLHAFPLAHYRTCLAVLPPLPLCTLAHATPCQYSLTAIYSVSPFFC